MQEVLNKFKMNECYPLLTPVECGIKLSKNDEGKTIDSMQFKSLVGSLRYLTCARPDIVYSVDLISQFMHEPKLNHWKAAKRIQHYIKGTLIHGLLYSFSNEFPLVDYSDSDWGVDLNNRKSTSSFVFYLGNTTIICLSKRKPIVALSTSEEEYVATVVCVCHSAWIQKLLKDTTRKRLFSSQLYMTSLTKW